MVCGKRIPLEILSPSPRMGLPAKSFSPQPSSADLSRPPGPILTRPLKLVGVIAKLYVVLESDLGMVLMDQHAAHERVLFEQMLSRMEDGEAPLKAFFFLKPLSASQPMLIF